jgi:D-alanyl-lipoteichoic acid acyltransferase DltB (MBOAT superfamily)
MLFNSIDFAIFLPLVFIVYWLLQNHGLKWQNALLLVSSYIFYGWWDWRFLSLIIFSSFIDYFLGLSIAKSDVKRKRKLFLILSLVVNLGFLGFFKYYNFFAQNFADAFTFFGQSIEPSRLNIILPVGISFYTFQTLSYTIDVYRKKLEPTRDIIAFFAFVSFFPQLVAGPIERATNLLPQFYKKREFNNNLAIDGLQQILWGLFKKIVIADNCAQYVNDIFNNYDMYSTPTLILGAVYFAFQIYGDFSGYSDIAIGTSKLFGFKLMTNFKYPYFSRDIAEFWRRWHISLSTWFRDYLYIPLGGSRGNKLNALRNTIIVFVVSGFWHGANWTFIVWGALNALYFLPLLLLKQNRRYLDNAADNRNFPSFNEAIRILMTFSIVTLAWVFFRAENISHAIDYYAHIFEFSIGIDRLEIKRYVFEIIPLIAILIGLEWFSRNEDHPMQKKYVWFKTIVIIIMILMLGNFSNMQDFIYFQF